MDRTDRDKPLNKENVHRIGDSDTETSFDYMVCTLPNDVSLRIGNAVCGQEAAIRFFSDSEHPRYNDNEAELRRTVRMAWESGEAEQRQDMMKIVREHRDKHEKNQCRIPGCR